MTTPMNDRMKAAMNAMDNARENAEQAVDTVKDGAEHAVASTRSAVMDGLHTVTKVLAMVRKLDGDDALGWVGLARRRSPLYTFAAFGAGIAVGAGVGLILAPMSGQKLRALILGRLMRAEARAEGKIEDVAAAAKEVEKDVENKVAAGVDAAKEALASKLDAATSGVQEVVHGVQEAAHGVKESADDAKVAVLRGRNGQSHANGRSQTRPPSPRLRAELEKALRPVEFPKSKVDLVAFASQQAPMEMEIVHALESVPDRTYRSAAEVIEHVTVPAETQQPAQRAH